MMRLLQFGLLSLCFASTAAYAQPSVIVENFRNVNCGNCREPDIQFEQWIEQNKSNFKVDIIYFHNEITDASDPFYQATKAEVDFRNGEQFYKVDANPRVIVQGLDAGSILSDWQNYVTGAATQAPKANVIVSDLSRNGDTVRFKVNVTNNSGEQVRVYAAVTESGIVYDNNKLYGNPPSGKWDHIFRKMLPDRDGTDPIGANGEFIFTLNLKDKPWKLEKMQAVVFAQAVNTIPQPPNSRPIWGYTVQSFGKLDVAPSSVSGFSIRSLANPVSTSAPLEVRMAQYGHLRIEMIDMTGKKIATIADNSLPEGVYQFNDRMELAIGAYVVNAYVDGNFAGQVKVIKN
jgi:hypothetical protein